MELVIVSKELHESKFIVHELILNPVPISCNCQLGASLSRFTTPVYTRTWGKAEYKRTCKSFGKRSKGLSTSCVPR